MMTSKPLKKYELIQLAIGEIMEKKLNVRTVAVKYGIPYSTLYDHMTKPHKRANGKLPLLLKHEEDILVKHMRKLSYLGLPVSSDDIISLVEMYLKSVRKVRPSLLGNLSESGWIKSFLTRHEDLPLWDGDPLDRPTIEQDQISEYFNSIKPTFGEVSSEGPVVIEGGPVIDSEGKFDGYEEIVEFYNSGDYSWSEQGRKIYFGKDL